MEPFDFFEIPLNGTRLIEASAGTGKTYTIAGLFLRLLLEMEMTVEQILVVTYTKAATEELKSRIRSRIVQARHGFVTGSADDDMMAELLERTADHRRASRLLDDALADFDRSAIFTIHGFCQRILHENAFETGNPYDVELVTDPLELRREIAEDFWRTHFYTAPPEWVSFAARNAIRGPSYFEQLAASVHILEANIIPVVEKPELIALGDYRLHFKRLVARWPEAREQVLDLMRSPVLDGRKYGSLTTGTREVRLAGLAAEMDRFTGMLDPDFPPFNSLDKFSAAGLIKAVRQGHEAPQHDLFDICDELQRSALALEGELQQLLLYLKTEFFQWAATELDRRKKNRNIQHYDDLLLTVKKALAPTADGQGQMLVDKARKKYRAALVDEFQDTDAVQYHIFATIFGNNRNLLFIIGDPKQSIYSFRGADIFSYMEAASRADSRHTLQKNWRSEPGLIKAVNALFAGTRKPFLFDAITCEPMQPAREPYHRGETTQPSLVLWYLPSEGSRPLNKTDAVPFVSEAVGDEIARLVNADGESVAAADIAVLVRTNHQASVIKESLMKREIPAVLYSTGSIFATREARELQRVLSGILESGRESCFRSALATDLIGISGDGLARADEQPSDWENRRLRFREYADLWKRFGFIRMFRKMLTGEKVRGRLLGYSDGERRLTNLLHLAELLHRETDSRRLPPAGLLKWLVDRSRLELPGDDEHQLRLESDELAVKIVTVHKSKGLEYPIVFCPFGWDGSTLRADGQVAFHSPNADGRLTVDLGSEQLPVHRVLAQHEVLAENLRLLYVAVTRAKRKCYLVWGRINLADTSALAYLLHLSGTSAEADVLAAMQERFAALDNEDIMTDLRKLADRSEGSIAIRNLPGRFAPPSPPATVEDRELVCTAFSGQIESDWKINSFSAMVSRLPQVVDLPDHDIDLLLPATIGIEALEESRQAVQATDRRTIFEFPRGARAGIFFHDLLEHLDFSPTAEQQRSDRIGDKLKQYGYEPDWQNTLHRTVDNLLRVRLPAMPAGDESFTLSEISPQNRVSEMEFTFPQKSLTPQSLGKIFKRHAGPKMPTKWSRHLQTLSFSPTSGYLMGYIDMLFAHGDRFYLLDWKSNHLGYRLKDYASDGLFEIMVSEHYILQYCLYTVAANRYLKLRRPDYNYTDDFGGVFYVFVRGVEADAGPGFGVYYDRPDPELVDALDNALIGSDGACYRRQGCQDH